MSDQPVKGRRPPGFFLAWLALTVVSLAIGLAGIASGMWVWDRWYLWGTALYVGALILVVWFLVSAFSGDDQVP